MEKIKISTVQALMIGITSIVVSGHLLFIPIVISHAGRDTWLSLLFAALPILFIGYVVSSLSTRYKGQTFVEYTQVIIGRWPGKFVSLIVILYLFHDLSLSIRGFGEFFTTAITPRTPIMVYFAAMIMVAVYAVRSGLEVMVRTNQIFLTLLIPIGLSATILTQKDKDYFNLLPILEFGFHPALRGMLVLVSLFSTFIVMSMVFPFVDDKKATIRKYNFWTMLLLIVMFIGPLTGPVLIFGAERAQGLFFPTFQILRDIEIGNLQRLDLVGILLWSMGSFSKITLFLYAICIGIAQIFGLKEYYSLAAPIGSLTVIIALLNSEDFIEFFRFLKNVFPFYSTMIGMGIPTLLLGVSILRNALGKKSKKKGTTSS